MRFLFLFRFVFRSDRFQFLYHQTVKHQNQTERYEKTANERVQSKRGRLMKFHLKRRHIIADINRGVILIPIDRTRIVAVFRAIFNLTRMRNQRYHQHYAERPRQNRNNTRNCRCAPFRRRNRMTDGYVTIRAHNKQKNRTRKLIDTRQNQIRFAHDRTEDPRLFDHRNDQKWYTDQETFVGNCEIHNVHVGDGLHFRETYHDVDDERVAEKTDQTDEGEEDLLTDEGGVVGWRRFVSSIVHFDVHCVLMFFWKIKSFFIVLDLNHNLI